MKKTFNTLAGSIFLLLLVSCGGVQVYTDYDEEIDFNRFKSFSFYEDMETGLDHLDEKRFEKALLQELKNSGHKPDSISPDFRINYYSDSYKKNTQHNIGLSIGTYGNHVGGSVGSGIPIHSTEQILSITVEFADAETNELFWQGITESKISPNIKPEERSNLFQKMVKKVLKKYPPH